MAWTDFPNDRHAVDLLRRSLDRNRLGHAYLFAGDSADMLERVAVELAATVNCTAPSGAAGGRDAGRTPSSACGRCSSCRRIQGGIHPDIHVLRAESKLRVLRVEQVRRLIQAVQLKPMEARYKVGILLGADRLNAQAANAFLKTLEEPPPRSLLILASTEPDQLLETILSRCLRLTFCGAASGAGEELGWLRAMASLLDQPPRSLLARYRLLDVLLRRLADLRQAAEAEVDARSPAQQYRDVDPDLAESWEEEAKAAVEAEFRRRRGQTLAALQGWFRDIWIATLGLPSSLLSFSDLASTTQRVAERLDPPRAAANLQLLEEVQQLLQTNVQEWLPLEVAMLRLHV